MSARLAAALVAVVLVLTACSSTAEHPDGHEATDAAATETSPDESAESATTGHDGHSAEPAAEVPLRKGERRETLAMPAAYRAREAVRMRFTLVGRTATRSGYTPGTADLGWTP